MLPVRYCLIIGCLANLIPACVAAFNVFSAAWRPIPQVFDNVSAGMSVFRCLVLYASITLTLSVRSYAKIESSNAVEHDAIPTDGLYCPGICVDIKELIFLFPCPK